MLLLKLPLPPHHCSRVKVCCFSFGRSQGASAGGGRTSPNIQIQPIQEGSLDPSGDTQQTVVIQGQSQPITATTTIMGGQKFSAGGFRAALKQHLLPILTISGVVGGIALGCILRYSRESPSSWTKREIMYVGYPGELFLRALKCLIIPLIVSSLVSAIGKENNISSQCISNMCGFSPAFL